MTSLLVTWLLSALSLLIVAHLIKGFEIRGFSSALIAAVVISLANGTIGFFLKVDYRAQAEGVNRRMESLFYRPTKHNAMNHTLLAVESPNNELYQEDHLKLE